MINFPYQLIDLTHTLEESCPTWTGGCGFTSKLIADYSDFDSEVKFKVNHLDLQAGIGTHMDAPSHCSSDGKNIDEIVLNDLAAPYVKIDVSKRANESYLVSLEDLFSFEKSYGQIPERAFILIYTGWEKYWKEPKKYQNDLRFPAVSKEAARYFVERQCLGLGIDTLSPDRPESGFPVHSLLLGSGRYIVENVANLTQLPPTGGYTLALPIKGKGCTEAPIRLVALIPKEKD